MALPSQSTWIGAAGQAVERLLRDPHRLLHLGHPHQVAVEVVAVLAERRSRTGSGRTPSRAASSRRSSGTPAARSSGPVIPHAMVSSRGERAHARPSGP